MTISNEEAEKRFMGIPTGHGDRCREAGAPAQEVERTGIARAGGAVHNGLRHEDSVWPNGGLGDDNLLFPSIEDFFIAKANA